MSKISKKHEVPFLTSALFCQNCGMLLNLQNLSKSEICCKFCDFKTDLDKITSENAPIMHSK